MGTSVKMRQGAKSVSRPEPRSAVTETAEIMADDKTKSKIGKYDAGQLDRWHRNAASEQEVRKAAEARTGKGATPGNQSRLRHGPAENLAESKKKPAKETAARGKTRK